MEPLAAIDQTGDGRAGRNKRGFAVAAAVLGFVTCVAVAGGVWLRPRLLVAGEAAGPDGMRVVDLPSLVVAMCAGVVAAGVIVLGLRRRDRKVIAALDARLRAEAAARAALDRLTQGSPALLYLGRVDPDGTYHRLFATRNAETVTGWPESTMENPDLVWSHVLPADADIRNTNFSRAMRLGHSTVEFRYRRPDDSVIWLRNEVVCIGRDETGTVEVAGVVTNVTREHELAAMADIQSRMATLGELATGLAHELTQPVTVIGMAAEMAMEMARNIGAPEALRRQISSVQTQSARASEIISHLRLYGHADGGRLGPVDLRRAMEGAMTLAVTPLHRAGVTVRVEIPDTMPAVRARSVQVEQVLINLLLNARDAMVGQPADDRLVLARGFTDEDDLAGAVFLEIRDSGPGVDPETLPRLFDSFFTTKAPGEGTGLGLSISRTLMQGFGGDITAASGEDGAVFTLRFQRA